MIQVKRMSHATFVTPDIERQIEYFTQVAGLALAEPVKVRAVEDRDLLHVRRFRVGRVARQAGSSGANLTAGFPWR